MERPASSRSGPPASRSHPPGRAASSIPPLEEPARQLMFDWRQLRRWGIDEERAARGQRRPLPREDALVGAPGKILGGSPCFSPRPLLIGALLVERRSRIRAQAGLAEAEQRYRTVADFTHDWEYWRRPDGSFAYVSPSCRRITGLRGRGVRRGGPPCSTSIVLDGGPAALGARTTRRPGSGRPPRLEFRIRAADGRGPLDRPRLHAGDGRGRDVPGPARLEPGRHREEAVGGASCGRPSPRSSGCASGSRPTTPTCASRCEPQPGFEGSSARATCCGTCCPRSSRWRPRRARCSSRARPASARSSSRTRSTT